MWGFAELSVGLFIVLSLLMVIVVSQLTMSDAASGFMNLVMSLCLVLMMLEPLKRLTALQGKTDSIKRALVPIDDLFEEQPDPEDSPQISSSDSVMDTPKHLADNVPLLVAHRLRFGFTPVKPALLRDLSLTVAAGERLGITGASGGGKSTLAELLVGLHRPWQGAVYLQGQRIEHWSKPQLSQKIGWVNKHPYFIHGTVRDNLLLWRDPVADDVLQNALHDACLQEVLTALPAGLDTPVAAEGANFSGGQRQRLEIARALLTRPSLLLLDEATDGLDHELELRLLTRLRQRGLTVILVSHRASTLAACDRRVRLVDGQLLTEDDPPLTTSEAQLTPDSGNTRQASNQRMDQRFSGGSVLTEPAAVNAHPEALLKAFRRVAAAIGEPPIKPLPNSLSKEKANQGYHGQTADETHIHALARYNQLAVREVRFVEQQWWQRDHGPLLVFDQETRQPLAVVPNNQGIYQAINPVTGISRSLTPEVSELLAPRAFVLYPRFDRSLAISGSLRTPLLKPDLIWALVCSLLITVLVMAVPVAGYLLQAELHPAANAQIITHWQIGLILLMTWLATESLRVYALLRIEGRLELSTCLMLYQHLVRLRPAFFTKHTPQSINRSLHSIPRLFDSLRNGTLRRLLAGLNGCAGLIFIALFSVKLALVAVLLLAPLFMIPLWLTVLRNTGYAAQMARRLDAIQTSRILLHNASRIRQAGHHWAMFDVWHKQYRQALDLLSPMLRLDSLAKAFEVFYPWLALSGFMLVVTLAQIAQGELPAVHAGQWLALLLAFMVTSLSFQGLSRALCDLLKALPMLKQLEPLLNAPLEPESGQEEKTRAELSGIAPIEVRNLSFMYPGVAQPLFKEVSMRIQPGEFVVLTGPSGGGKSTLLRILLGFLANDSGEIVRDGQRQDENSALSHWRDSVATVLQEEQLLVAQSIRGHITGGDFYSMEHVFEAARLAMLEDDIAAMPMGIQSIINSDTVSTGQKQRLLIANRLLRHPRLLILDESTNAIPEAIQVQLFANLRSIGVTCLVVSHRASVIAEADRVYVLNNGTMSQLRPETKQTGGLQQ
uniref:Uncharacterized protein n=1 Tax=uncultured Thiotrichaceae bacterium TaxID=298394 RepID=A0A6S6RYD0_9GAMM|nr:MAG: Unknown protein [uncultured Thiotrichaceae bacterium]